MSHTGHLSSTDANNKAAELLTEALKRAAAAGSTDSLEDLSEAIGFAERNRGAPLSAMSKGLRTFSWTKVVQFIANKPRHGHALVSVLTEFCVKQLCIGVPANRVNALDAVIAAALDLARDACLARSDNHVDDAEGARLTAKIEVLRRAVDVFVHALGATSTQPAVRAVRT